MARGRRSGRVYGRISAPDRTPLKRIIAYLNVFAEVGVERFVFTGIERAPRAVWDLPALPR